MTVITPVAAEFVRLEEALAASERDAQTLVASLTEAQGGWRPVPGSWCIAECLDHMATANRVYLDAMTPSAARALADGRRRRRPALPGVIGRWFISSLEPPAKPLYRRKAPRLIAPRTRRWPMQWRRSWGRRTTCARWYGVTPTSISPACAFPTHSSAVCGSASPPACTSSRRTSAGTCGRRGGCGGDWRKRRRPRRQGSFEGNDARVKPSRQPQATLFASPVASASTKAAAIPPVSSSVGLKMVISRPSAWPESMATRRIVDSSSHRRPSGIR